MKVLFIARASLHNEPGGDAIQILNTAKCLRTMGVEVDIRLTNEVADYSSYQLLHFFNITRPADILLHLRRSRKPFVVSPIFVEYTEFDRVYRKGISGKVFRSLPVHTVEYLKALARSVFNGERIVSREYLWMGQKTAIQQVLDKAAFLLPNSYNEYKRLKQHFNINNEYSVIPNGIDPGLFYSASTMHKKDESLVICVARIEGIKNQLNLIKAMSGSRFRLLLIGKVTRNQQGYWESCKRAAGANVRFVGKLPQEELVRYYTQAKVHILPSWFETTGLSSLEAAAMGCNIVITDRGDAKEYFGPDACYCDPSSPESIYNAVEKAATQQGSDDLRRNILQHYTWKVAAEKTKLVYTSVLNNNPK